MNGSGLRISRSDVQQIIGELGRRTVLGHLGEMPSRLGLDAAENIGRSATPIFAIPTGHPPRLHSYRRPDFLMQNHRFLVDTHHWFPCRERLLIDCQYILHARDVLLIEFGHAPHFFPATVLDRGFRAGFGLSLVPLAVPVCVSPPPPLASALSTPPGPPVPHCKPEPRCPAAVGHPTALPSPAAPLRIMPDRVRLADSVGWSARPSSRLTPHCGPPCGSFARPPVAAAPRRVAPFAPAADRPATVRPIAPHPSWTTQT